VSDMVTANLILSAMANTLEYSVLGFLILPGSFHLVSRCECFMLIPETDKVSSLYAESEV